MPTTASSAATTSPDQARSPATRTAAAPMPPPKADRTSRRNTALALVGWNERPERAAHSLVADLFSEQRVVDELDLSAAQLHGPTALEIEQHAVDRHARRADERGEILLRQRNDVGPEELALIDQKFREAPREVQAPQMLDGPRAA